MHTTLNRHGLILQRNVLWIPSSLIRLAGALVRRELPRGFLERQGLYQATRPLKNPLLWFHANSAGVFRCEVDKIAQYARLDKPFMRARLAEE